MQLLACFWIALCLVVDTSTKSVTSSDDETSIEDLPILLHGDADGSITAEQCKCENGVCKENDKGKFVCTCPSEWGFLTSSHCKKCDCGKDSNCTFTGFWVKKTCICKVGYEDKDGFCKGTCRMNPCRNGGQCKVQGDDIECECKNLFIGERCEKGTCEVNSDCNNGGECVNKLCVCLNGTSGDHCEIIPDCQDRDCGDAAKCIYLPSTQSAACKCIHDGYAFDEAVWSCKRSCYDDTNCMNGAECKRNGMTKFCECLKGTEGDFCETVSVCKYLNCGPDARCTYDVQMQTATCLCRNDDSYFDYKERRCRKRPLITTSTSVEMVKTTRNSTIHPTHHPTSSPSGHSLNFTVGRESTLRLTTLLPTTGVDPCTESPCQNGGTCLVVGNRMKCFCKKPYFGNLCEKDPCDWNPCKNGGVCKTEYETVRCYCKEPFTGEFCESRIRIDMYVITLVAGSVLLAIILTLVTCNTCILWQRYHIMRTRSEYS